MYYSLGSAKTMATCQNMLFFGNVGAENIPYNELTDLSLHFLPYLKEEVIKMLNHFKTESALKASREKRKPIIY